MTGVSITFKGTLPRTQTEVITTVHGGSVSLGILNDEQVKMLDALVGSVVESALDSQSL